MRSAPTRFLSLVISLLGQSSLLTLNINLVLKGLLCLIDLTLVSLVKHLCREDEGLLDILACFRRCLNEKIDVVFLGEPLTLLAGDFSLAFSIFLIADENDDCIWLRLLANF